MQELIIFVGLFWLFMAVAIIVHELGHAHYLNRKKIKFIWSLKFNCLGLIVCDPMLPTEKKHTALIGVVWGLIPIGASAMYSGILAMVLLCCYLYGCKKDIHTIFKKN